MEKVFSEEEYNRVKKIKEDFDNGKISIDDISNEDANIILKIYDYQIKSLKAEILSLTFEIEEYKERMKEAIEQLKKQKE